MVNLLDKLMADRRNDRFLPSFFMGDGMVVRHAGSSALEAHEVMILFGRTSDRQHNCTLALMAENKNPKGFTSAPSLGVELSSFPCCAIMPGGE